MSNYEHPLYLTEVEAEELLGVVAAYCSDEDGHEYDHGLASVIGQMSNDEHPLYLTEVEAEELFGVVLAYCSDEDGHEYDHEWASVIGQLDRILHTN